MHYLELSDDELFAINICLSLDPQVNFGDAPKALAKRFDLGRIQARWKVREYVESIEPTSGTAPKTEVENGPTG